MCSSSYQLRQSVDTMDEKEPAVGQLPSGLAEDGQDSGHLPVERAGVTEIEKIERVYR